MSVPRYRQLPLSKTRDNRPRLPGLQYEFPLRLRREVFREVGEVARRH